MSRSAPRRPGATLRLPIRSAAAGLLMIAASRAGAQTPRALAPCAVPLARAEIDCALGSGAAQQVPGADLSFTSQPTGVSVRLRGVSAVSGSVAWASGAGGTILRTTDGGAHWSRREVPGAETLDFRDIDAFSALVAYALSIGPDEASRIYKTTDGGSRWSLQFQAKDPKMFLDAMSFRDASHGFAFGDSVDGLFVILTTENGGRAWNRVSQNGLPPALPNEGAFAASGTNVALHGRDLVWIATSASRVLRSTDAGRSFTVSSTPVAAGPTAGIFSIAFRDSRHGVVVGGDYKIESQARDNVAITSDGGATWTLVQEHGLSGFRSVVAWVPGAPGTLIAMGPTGADVSRNDGRSWTPLPGTGDTLGFAPGGAGWSAGLGGIVSRREEPEPRRPKK